MPDRIVNSMAGNIAGTVGVTTGAGTAVQTSNMVSGDLVPWISLFVAVVSLAFMVWFNVKNYKLNKEKFRLSRRVYDEDAIRTYEEAALKEGVSHLQMQRIRSHLMAKRANDYG